jgi:predicted nucleotidyltransferase component of viral defense system
MNLYRYDKSYFDQRAKETGFIRDTLEKVYRLADILEYVNQNPMLRECLALKGGTAINLLVFDMPRLSVDIDFDFYKLATREETLEYRKNINNDLVTFLQTQGYSLNHEKGKSPHSLDSMVFWYINSAGNRDNIKIEINYSMRAHILPIVEMPVKTRILDRNFSVKVLSLTELFGSKINALISRTVARDLYDIDNMIRLEIFDKSHFSELKKCVIFYLAISGSKEIDTIDAIFDLTALDNLKWAKIRQSLLPVLNRNENFDLDASKTRVKGFINELLRFNRNEAEFMRSFKDKKYLPELLFEDRDIIDRIKNHPMALWKCKTALEESK